jgi:drug/metabolite transporter (DMT)-like permease
VERRFAILGPDRPTTPPVAGLPNPADRRLGLLQIHVATLLFGGAGLFGKLLDVGPAVITAGRTFFGSFALLVACWFTGTNLQIRTRRDLAMLLAAGAVLGIHWYSFFAAIQVSSIAIALLAFASLPMFVTFLEPIFFGHRLAFFDLVAAAAVIAGLLLLVPSNDLGSNLTQGVCWGVFSGFMFSVFSLLSRANVRKYPQLMVTAYQQAFALCIVLPVAATSVSSITLRTVWLLAVLGFVFTAAAHALFIGSLKYIRAQTASIIVGLEPVYAILFAALVLREIPAERTMIGGLLILAAAAASTRRTAQSARSF